MKENNQYYPSRCEYSFGEFLDYAKPSFVIWNALKEIFRNRPGITFGGDGKSEYYSFIPESLRWKNYFLSNMFWPYTGKSQKGMISFGGNLKELSDSSDYLHMNIDKWVDLIKGADFKIYLADETIRDKEVKERLCSENNIVITQRDCVEEFLSTIIGKIYFSEVEGYFVGDFAIPPILREDYFGIPDIVGLKGSFVNDLKSNGITGNGGLLEDLPIWRHLRSYARGVSEVDEAIVSEVKSSNHWLDAYQQLYYRGNDTHKPGYLNSHCFNKGYACYGSLYPRDEKAPARIEAGALIFCGNPPYRFAEDSIVSGNASSSRRQKSMQVDKDRRKALMADASCRSARWLLAGADIEIARVFPGIEKMKLNAALSEIEKASVESIIKKII